MSSDWSEMTKAGRTVPAGAHDVPNRRKGSKRQCRSSILQRGELALPGECVGHDGGEIVELRPPPEQFFGAVRLRNDPYRIARSGTGVIDAKIDAGYAFDGTDHVEHGKSVAVAAVKRHRPAARPQIGKGIAMSAHQIGDVDVVADASAVGRW